MFPTFLTAPHRLVLVDDETLVLRVTNHDESFRVRVWRAADTTSVVLVSQVPGSIPPRTVTERIANVIKSAYLAHAGKGMYYFEADARGLQTVSFVGHGHGDRSRLCQPNHRTASRDFLEDLLGQAITP